MDRKTLDKLISSTGAVLAVVLLIGGVLLTWAGGFVNAQVSNQLTAQRITMPAGDAIAKLENEADRKALEPFAGQPLEGPRQAQAFADHYILAHMNASSGGRTYEEVSGEYTKLSDEEKASEDGQALGALRQTLFMGNTLRGTLLTAYAFGTIGEIAFIAAGVAYAGAVGLGVLSFLGFRHAKRIQSVAQTTPVAVA
ncbi:hypothetical protein GCM10010401_00070 [Rarobacter faecitabidus]|uniref:Aromatic ring-opening dioxygenase LigA n=1 Tax=Rarobacter faecitabidus TaxID=13243 RepID=A0A542ZWY4_RARFA|nr:hypothetical protein [Rarobacter faecitabidus]TQL64852.1 hypothetical protein FB461_1375 [Rarobacter faecitabidus]